MGRQLARRFAARSQDSLAADLADLVQDLARSLFDGYRPELHYMRGPGPKWREKHAVAVSLAVPQTGATPLFPEGVPA